MCMYCKNAIAINHILEEKNGKQIIKIVKINFPESVPIARK